MGMVHAAQQGEKAASPEVAEAAASMSKKSAKEFASTSHKGLPEHKKMRTRRVKDEPVRKMPFKK